MLLAEVAKGKSSMTCVKISSGTVQLEVCHSAFAFHGFCHTRAELQTISPSRKGFLMLLSAFSPFFFCFVRVLSLLESGVWLAGGLWVRSQALEALWPLNSM